jgi:hypothetical protein
VTRRARAVIRLLVGYYVPRNLRIVRRWADRADIQNRMG